MKDVRVVMSNPILTSRDQRDEYNEIIGCADVNQNIAYVRLHVDKLEISNGDGFTKKYKYPEGATLPWVLQKITAFSVTNHKHKDTAYHARAREVFLGPFMHVLNHKHGVVTVGDEWVTGVIPGYKGDWAPVERFEVRMARKHFPPDVMEELMKRCKKYERV